MAARQARVPGRECRSLHLYPPDNGMNPVATKNGQRLRDTGLEAVGEVPWGTHFSIFYETKKDLLEVLVPYFNTGLRNNEFCLWIVASYEFLNVTKATNALRKSIPSVDRLIDKGNIEIVAHTDWFLTR